LDEVYGYKFQPRQMPDFESSIIWVWTFIPLFKNLIVNMTFCKY
jgi:hypothetical protein